MQISFTRKFANNIWFVQIKILIKKGCLAKYWKMSKIAIVVLCFKPPLCVFVIWILFAAMVYVISCITYILIAFWNTIRIYISWLIASVDRIKIFMDKWQMSYSLFSWQQDRCDIYKRRSLLHRWKMDYFLHFSRLIRKRKNASKCY